MNFEVQTNKINRPVIVGASNNFEQVNYLKALIADSFSGDKRRKPRKTFKIFFAEFFSKVYDEILFQVLPLLFAYVANLRDIKGGKGERDLSYFCILEMSKYQLNLVIKFLPLFVREYGSYGDLCRIYLIATQEPEYIKNAIQQQCVDIFVNQLIYDDNILGSGNYKVSLAVKHAPVERRGNKNIPQVSLILNQMAIRIALNIHFKTVEVNCGDMSYIRTQNYALMKYRKLCSRLNDNLKLCA